MKKIKEKWLDFKSSIRWNYAIFWLIVFNVIIIPIWTMGSFFMINFLFLLMLIYTWNVHIERRKRFEKEEVKTEPNDVPESVEDKECSRKVEIEEGCIWEGPNFEIQFDRTVGKSDDPCRHVQDGKLRAVVVAHNEGGYNSTGVCVDCLIKALEDNGLVEPIW